MRSATFLHHLLSSPVPINWVTDRAAAFVHWNLAAPGGESARRHRCACGGCYCGGRIRGHECADTGANWMGATVGTCVGIRTDGRRATISSSELAVRSSLKHGFTICHSQRWAANVGLKSNPNLQVGNGTLGLHAPRSTASDGL